MNKPSYYGIGNADNASPISITIFFRNKALTIAFYTKKYKFIPRFYYYKDLYTYDCILVGYIKWFFGLAFKIRN